MTSAIAGRPPKASRAASAGERKSEQRHQGEDHGLTRHLTAGICRSAGLELMVPGQKPCGGESGNQEETARRGQRRAHVIGPAPAVLARVRSWRALPSPGLCNEPASLPVDQPASAASFPARNKELATRAGQSIAIHGARGTSSPVLAPSSGPNAAAFNTTK